MRKTVPADVDVSVEVAGIRLRTPIMLASGVLGETGELLLAAHKAGAGAVVTKSIGLESRDGHRNPSIYECDCGMLNAMGLPNPGIEEFKKEMAFLERSGAIVIGSVFGAKPADFSRLARKMEGYGAKAIELNLSCPHARGYGTEIGSNPAQVRKVTSEVVKAVKVPVWAKLTPNTSDICSLGLAAEEAGASAVVAINTIRAMMIDPYLKVPVLGNKFGGLSGEAVKPVGVRCVFELASALRIPVIGVGGIMSGIDVAEYLMAGASAVQIGTVVRSRGLNAFSAIAEELVDFMASQGYRTIDDLKGAAHGE